MSHMEILVLDALTPSFKNFCGDPVLTVPSRKWAAQPLMQLSLISGFGTRLSNLESDSMCKGPATYINIIGAGEGNNSEFFRLYVGQSLNLRVRLEQHSNPNHRKREYHYNMALWMRAIAHSGIYAMAIFRALLDPDP